MSDEGPRLGGFGRRPSASESSDPGRLEPVGDDDSESRAAEGADDDEGEEADLHDRGH